MEDENEKISPEFAAKLVQALVFASPDILTNKKIAEIVGEIADSKFIASTMEKANEGLEDQNSPFEIVFNSGGWRFRTREEYYPWVKKLFHDTSGRRLSQAALETLSIIAYKQPVTKAEIETVRGVSCDGPLKNLLERKLINLGPRSDSPGQAFTYLTTKEFLKYFGLNRIPEDLPRLREFDDLLQSNQLVPQYQDGELVEEEQVETDPNQVDLVTAENSTANDEETNKDSKEIEMNQSNSDEP